MVSIPPVGSLAVYFPQGHGEQVAASMQKEAKRSNAILHKIITEAISDTVGSKLIGLVTSRAEIPELLRLDDVIDLVIPRGSNKLVSDIKSSTKIPILGHADGICHVYVDKSANLEMAKQITLNPKKKQFSEKKHTVEGSSQIINQNHVTTLKHHTCHNHTSG